MAFGSKIESLEELFRMHPEKFLRIFAPHRAGMIKSILDKIEFSKFKGRLIADLTMPMNIGGYYSPDRNVIAINPMLLLHGKERDIAHVLYHEGLHSGIYSEGTEIMEEVVVETMTKKRMAELYGESTFRSGYDGMVKEAEEFFGELSYEEMVEQIEDGNDETFDNFLELAVVRPLIGEEDHTKLRWSEIRKSLKKKWSMLKKLFPRMINKVAKNNKGLHEDAEMEAYEYKLENLLERAAKDIFSNHKEILSEIFVDVSDGASLNPMNSDRIKKLLTRLGYGYLLDEEPKFMEKMIDQFIVQSEILKENDEEVTAEKIILSS